MAKFINVCRSRIKCGRSKQLTCVHMPFGDNGVPAQVGFCDFADGDSAILIQADVLSPVGVLVNGEVLIDGNGTSLVWTPRNDISLYGLTAPVTAMQAAGVNLMLGTRWNPTGSLNMFKELQCAASFNQTYLDSRFTPRSI